MDFFLFNHFETFWMNLWELLGGFSRCGITGLECLCGRNVFPTFETVHKSLKWLHDEII